MLQSSPRPSTPRTPEEGGGETITFLTIPKSITESTGTSGSETVSSISKTLALTSSEDLFLLVVIFLFNDSILIGATILHQDRFFAKPAFLQESDPDIPNVFLLCLLNASIHFPV